MIVSFRPRVLLVMLALVSGVSGCGGVGKVDLEGSASGVNDSSRFGQGGTTQGAQDPRDQQQSAAPRCGDGIVQTGETCDPPSACMTTTASCPAAPACSLAVLSGLADQCNVVCSVTPITQCQDKDQCCAPGCDATSDSDCFRPELPAQGRGTEEGYMVAMACLPEKYDECAT